MIESARRAPAKIEDRLIVALDLPTIAEAREMVRRLDGIVSFFKIGLWLLYASGVDALIDELLAGGKRVFLDAKMYDIGETVKQGVARAAARDVTFLTVHGDGDIMKAAVEGKGASSLKIFAISALTSLDEAGLRELGYSVSIETLVAQRVKNAVRFGVDGIIASAQDGPNRLRTLGGSDDLLVTTPGIRLPGGALDDHKRAGTPAQAIRDGADYLVVGRPIIRETDPAKPALAIIADMRQGAAA